MTAPHQLVTRKTKRIIGRTDLLAQLKAYLHARGERHFIYLYGSGGVGKTRVLETVQMMVEQAAAGYYSTGIIDLSHTDSHSTSDVERTIIESLDPHKRYFQKYREARDRYERMRESGTDPQVLENRRLQLSEFFVDGCRQMGLDAHKLVLLFDTVELLQYESSSVERIAALDTVDARIKTWLLNNLAKLGNVLVVFAGRPKLAAPGETDDPQARLLGDMQDAFGDAFHHQELEPLTVEEAQAMVQELGQGQNLISADLLPVVHMLTGGRPVFLHLVVDLLLTLADTPGQVEDIFRKHADLLGRPEDDPEVIKARKEVQAAILRGIFNETSRNGWFLDRLAMMPKGVDAEILHQTVGMTLDEAEALLNELRPLSFIKTHQPLEHDFQERQVLPGRIYLHDELYSLLRLDIIPSWRYAEVQVAHALVRNYYDPQIANLEADIETLDDPDARVPLRARMQKLQVERLYYLLVHDPLQGYETYKRLTERANWWRWVGYSNRLLDEFLRYYNDPQRRKDFENRGLHETTVRRESAALWAERFYWWGQFSRCIAFANDIIASGNDLVPEDDLITRSNIIARKLICWTALEGYSETETAQALQLLAQLPAIPDSRPQELLARARLSAAVGYQFQQGGLLDEAITYYEDTKTCFRELEVHTDAYKGELAIWLHALAFVYAQQGLITLAMPLVREALRINESLRYEWNTGLTLSALSGIERMAGQNDSAVRHAQEALDLFRKLEDPHGICLSYLKLIQANRRKAKGLIENGRKLEEAQQILEKECLLLVKRGIQVANDNHLDSRHDLLAEMGRTYRDLGHVLGRRYGLTEALPRYHDAVTALRSVLEETDLPLLIQADTRQDLAEVLFFSRSFNDAEAELQKIEALIGAEYIIKPDGPPPATSLPVGRFAPLGKVELLRGQMIFAADPPRRAHKDLVEGMQHHLLAYAYFARFSQEALEKNNMVEYIYNYMSPIAPQERRSVMSEVQEWAKGSQLGVEDFLYILNRLLT